uniref:Uncharacterized protein n=1 Tax=Arundo donax TaxID=35708 RepID=A0A0A8Z409_ARUDO
MVLQVFTPWLSSHLSVFGMNGTIEFTRWYPNTLGAHSANLRRWQVMMPSGLFWVV